MLANGWNEVQIFGRGEVDVDSILLGFTDTQEGHPVPTWAARMVGKTLVNEPLPVRLASAYILAKMMRVSLRTSADESNTEATLVAHMAEH